MKRKRLVFIIVGLVAAFALMALGGCGGGASTTTTPPSSGATTAPTTGGEGTTTTSGPATGTPIKIGVLRPITGPQVHEGTGIENGLKTYFETVGNQVAGRPIQLIFEDDASNTQQGLDRARKLVEQDKVNIITMPVNSGVTLAAASYTTGKETPTFVPVSHADALTGEDRSPYLFRTVESTKQRSVLPAYYTVKKLGLKKAAVFSWDFVVGQEMIKDFSDAYKSFGGDVVYSIAAPLGTQDFGPYLSQVDKSKIDVIYAFFASPDNIRFVPQLQQFGFSPSIQVVDNGTLTEDGVLSEQGEAALGVKSVTCYSNALDNPENKEFMRVWAEKFNGAKPSWYDFQGWQMAMAIEAGIKAANGNVEDKEAFLAATQGIKINTPGGAFFFDDKGQAVLDQYDYEVVKLDDGSLGKKWLGNKWEAVGQDWTPPAE